MRQSFAKDSDDDDLPPEVKEAVLAALREEGPVTIGVVGVSGVGKSSIINRLFRTDFATSPTVACTKEFVARKVELTASRGPAKGTVIRLQVVDAPGLGESRDKDPEYLEMYKRHLPKCDAVLWVSAARNRAVSLEQDYLEALRQFHEKMVFGLGQADLVDPTDWKENINLPSPTQERNLREIGEDRASKFAPVVGFGVDFIPFSAKRSYNLQVLFTSLVGHARRERGWLLSSIKGFAVDDWMTEEVRSALSAELAARESDILRDLDPGKLPGIRGKLFGRGSRSGRHD
ncbi:MAG: GTPase family protein [Pseudonocardiaceae bacterium]